MFQGYQPNVCKDRSYECLRIHALGRFLTARSVTVTIRCTALMRAVNRCAAADITGPFFVWKAGAREQSSARVLSSSGACNTVRFNYANKLICAGGAPQALQPCLRLRADGVLRHNTLPQRGRHLLLVSPPPATRTPVPQPQIAIRVCAAAALKWGNVMLNSSNSLKYLRFGHSKQNAKNSYFWQAIDTTSLELQSLEGSWWMLHLH